MTRDQLYEIALISMRVINALMVWLIVTSFFLLAVFRS
jgi:hypothetical protein